jgi:predicted hotdog family 3-hydroxylacyl-ACP dehydratase
MTSGSKTKTRATPDAGAWRERVPHAGPMLLVTGVVRHADDETVCEVSIAEQKLFRDADGSVPAWLALEYMAQCIAVHAALSGSQEGPPPLGFLVSARGLRLHCARFEPAQTLEAAARKLWVGGGGLSSFACSLHDAGTRALLAEGRINCFVPPDGALP